MSFSMCPRTKRAETCLGEFVFDELRIFTVGDGERFARALRILCPTIKIKKATRDDANLILSVARVFSSQNEYCNLHIRENLIEIQAKDAMGARNAAAIFAQIVRAADGVFKVPAGFIEDYPDAEYRGFMLESSGRKNTWMPMSLIREYITKMALARMNELQFHFMEGLGTTIELDSFPSLAGGENGQKYTKAEVREMIEYADELGITVTPFVEVISHSIDFTKKADIACPGDNPKNMFAVCVGQEKTYEAIERILTEVAELFPAPVIHIGGDEYDMCRVTPYTAHWEKCPNCQALAKREGLKKMRDLFHYALERTNKIVNRLGKIAMVWNADMKPGELPEWLERNIVVHFFRTNHPYAKDMLFGMYPDGYARDGFAIINSYFPNTYLNDGGYYAKDELVNNWSYHRTPAISRENRQRMIGGCCCAWQGETFVRVIPPAIFLFADRLWNADDSGVPYDDEYGRTLTRLLFDGKLPENMNVFNAVGGIMPPQIVDQKVHFKLITAPLSEIREIRHALEVLADEGHRLAAIYADMARAAEEYIEALPDDMKPLDEAEHFIG